MTNPEFPPGRSELRELIAAATGGFRVLDANGEIEIRANNAFLCEGHEDGICWMTPGDAAFTARVSPYVVHCLLNELESAERRCEEGAVLLRKHGLTHEGATVQVPPGVRPRFPWMPFRRQCDLEDPPNYENGAIEVREDGSLELTPDDPHFYGEISREQACTLAWTILRHLWATQPPSPPSAP